MLDNADILIINNTGADIDVIHEAIMTVIRGGEVPEEIADLVTVTPVDGYPGRYRVDAA